MTAAGALLLETAERAFAKTCTHDAVQHAERDGWAPRIWDTAAGIGLPWVGVPEAAGGAGGSLGDALGVLGVAGHHAAPIPLAETGLLAGWLLSSAGLPVGEGPMSVVPGLPADDLRWRHGAVYGTAHRVPWARAVEQVVALVGGAVVALSPARARIEPVTNLAGEPRDTLVLDGVVPDAVADAPEGIDADALHLRGALTRVALMAGALLAMSELTAAYTSERRQFGQPIGRFQAVQALVVRCAEEAMLVDLAAQVAAREAERGDGRFEIAAAKLLADDAARVATRAAHQAHGAIGMTQEYSLHQLSRRLWSWRAEYGDRTWPDRIGRAVLAHGRDDLYRVIAEGSASGIRV
ncbi:MAG TPA: acyl-CoA dehydrogenase family protein [Acidimicrobiia bacterium]|jgi:acyl-CoA dehydrogenase